MKRLTFKQAFLFVSFAGIILSCQKGKEYKTESGFKYILYTKNTGKKPALGDYVVVEMVYKTENDSILFDSRANKVPMRFKLEKIPFAGSYEEGITYLSEGDSATFYVPADSLYNYYFKDKQDKPEQEATVFKKNKFLLFDVRLIKVQNYIEAEQEELISLSAKEKSDRNELNSFLMGKEYRNSPDSGMYYYKILKEGTGTQISKGKIVAVRYTGKFLNGEVFSYAGSPEKPFAFRAGEGEVIKAWDLALSNLREGDRIEIVIPPATGYGEEGLLDTKTGSYIVPPFSSLLYDLEILMVGDTLKFVKK
ncbi:MAG TPA: FKBP-type peptidyl-prolyl cis-trans isomerase [Bacteroidia bacterium]|nr:FKBP-type peptidyl-prolyl cis-trans isomerase [Bacteroidia bacterium]HNS13594.1 FKBP-type peptidyl-prolyl cis-trans isomerase [Bacteroidia bacterium]